MTIGYKNNYRYNALRNFLKKKLRESTSLDQRDASGKIPVKSDKTEHFRFLRVPHDPTKKNDYLFGSGNRITLLGKRSCIAEVDRITAASLRRLAKNKKSGITEITETYKYRTDNAKRNTYGIFAVKIGAHDLPKKPINHLNYFDRGIQKPSYRGSTFLRVRRYWRFRAYLSRRYTQLVRQQLKSKTIFTKTHSSGLGRPLFASLKKTNFDLANKLSSALLGDAAIPNLLNQLNPTKIGAGGLTPTMNSMVKLYKSKRLIFLRGENTIQPPAAIAARAKLRIAFYKLRQLIFFHRINHIANLYKIRRFTRYQGRYSHIGLRKRVQLKLRRTRKNISRSVIRRLPSHLFRKKRLRRAFNDEHVSRTISGQLKNSKLWADQQEPNDDPGEKNSNIFLAYNRASKQGNYNYVRRLLAVRKKLYTAIEAPKKVWTYERRHLFKAVEPAPTYLSIFVKPYFATVSGLLRRVRYKFKRKIKRARRLKLRLRYSEYFRAAILDRYRKFSGKIKKQRIAAKILRIFVRRTDHYKKRRKAGTRKYGHISFAIRKRHVCLYFTQTKNNIFYTILNRRGDVVKTYSNGQTMFKGPRRISTVATEIATKHLVAEIRLHGVRFVKLVLRARLRYLLRPVIKILKNSRILFTGARFVSYRAHSFGMRARTTRRV